MNIEFVGTCSDPSIARIADKSGRKASYKKACRAILDTYPDMHYSLALEYYNPWEDDTRYILHRSKKYLCLVHSEIDYLFLIHE